MYNLCRCLMFIGALGIWPESNAAPQPAQEAAQEAAHDGAQAAGHGANQYMHRMKFEDLVARFEESRA